MYTVYKFQEACNYVNSSELYFAVNTVEVELFLKRLSEEEIETVTGLAIRISEAVNFYLKNRDANRVNKQIMLDSFVVANKRKYSSEIIWKAVELLTLCWATADRYFVQEASAALSDYILRGLNNKKMRKPRKRKGANYDATRR